MVDSIQNLIEILRLTIYKLPEILQKDVFLYLKNFQDYPENNYMLNSVIGQRELYQPYLSTYFKYYPEDFIVREVVNNKIMPLKPNLFFKLPGTRGKNSEIIHGILVKKNLETFTLLKIIKSHFKGSKPNIYLAGIKDKRALTAQRIAFTNTTKEEIISLNSKLKNSKIHKICQGTFWQGTFCRGL